MENLYTGFNQVHTHIINLPARIDRRQHILHQFDGKQEFLISIIHPVKEVNPEKSLWETVKQIIFRVQEEKTDFVIICEDDHQFTASYSQKLLFGYIKWAQHNGADVLLGGISSFKTCFKTAENVYWIERFTGTQFTILFRSIYSAILNVKFRAGNTFDSIVSDLTKKIFVIHPFISIQKEFGYSDVTFKNNLAGRVDDLFQRSSEGIRLLNNVSNFYTNRAVSELSIDIEYDSISIPTYILHFVQLKERFAYIKTEFADKPEFNTSIISVGDLPFKSVESWDNICKIVEIALQNDEDVIIICKDNHKFTTCYDKRILIRNIYEAYAQGCDLLLGGITEGADHILFVNSDRAWISSFSGTQFMILFKAIFNKILKEKFNDSDTVDGTLSGLTSQKMVLFPFISIQQPFNNFHDIERPIDGKNLVHPPVKNMEDRMGLIQSIQFKLIPGNF